MKKPTKVLTPDTLYALHYMCSFIIAASSMDEYKAICERLCLTNEEKFRLFTGAREFLKLICDDSLQRPSN